MGWTDVFPVFTEEMVEEYEAQATAAEKSQMEEWYGVERVCNAQPECREVVSVSLFWKNVREGDAELPTPTRERMQNAQEDGNAKRFVPWDHYVKPLLELAPRWKEKFPGVALRVYLAKDLEFLVEDLVEANCEVYLMKSSSISFAPGGLWRFLPFEEEGKLVTVTDVDRLNELEGDLARTRMMGEIGLDAWRVPVPTDQTGDYRVCYLPFMGCQFGVRGGALEVRKLLDAFTWKALRGEVETMVIYPGCGPLPIQSTTWPHYGFDEYFMTVAAYPRLAQGGMLTFVPSTARSMLLSLDVEYVTWGNPQSELVYFDGGRCCGGLPIGAVNPEAFGAAGEELGEEEVESPVGMRVVEDAVVSREVEPKLGFLFLSRGDVLHPGLWREYVEQGGDGLMCLAHCKERDLLEEESFLKSVLIEKQVETVWGGISLVEASLELLREGVEGSDCTHFVMLSESCVPVRPLAELMRSVRLDGRSRMRVTPWEAMRRQHVLKAQRVENLRGIRKELAHFQHQWMLLSRRDAELILENDRLEAFAEVHCPDEVYFATVLAAAGRPPLQSVANRQVTWVDWTTDGSHPRQFGEVSPETVAQIADSGCFFARKFGHGSDIGKYGLHREGAAAGLVGA